jgi:hypothetical protein
MFLTLACCTSASPRFLGAARDEVSVEGSRFIVFRRASEVEVHRVSTEWRPRESVVLAKAIIAIETSTGCRVRPGSMTGDPAIIRASLDC